MSSNKMDLDCCAHLVVIYYYYVCIYYYVYDNVVVNGSVAVFVGETIRVEEDVRVTIDCSQLIDAASNNGFSNVNVTWYKDGNPITNESVQNVFISADYRDCVITNTSLAVGGQLGNDGLYTCEVCNFTTSCMSNSSINIVCGK